MEPKLNGKEAKPKKLKSKKNEDASEEDSPAIQSKEGLHSKKKKQQFARVPCFCSSIFLPSLSRRWKESKEKETRERPRRAGKGERAKKESEERSKEEERYMIQAVWRTGTEKFKTTLLQMCSCFLSADSGTDDEDDEEEETPKKKTKKKTAKDSSPSASSAKEKKSKSKGKALNRQSEGHHKGHETRKQDSAFLTYTAAIFNFFLL